jgi:four helix bundle protein
MAGYQDLRVWQLGIEITKKVYQLTASFPPEEKFGLTSQLRRCAVSIPSNIAEGHSRESRQELTRFCLIAKGSLAELETQLIIAKEFNFGNRKEIDTLMGLVLEEGRMLSGLRRSLRSKKEN